jgi:hypothetical protein
MFCAALLSSFEQLAEKAFILQLTAYPDITLPKITEQFHVLVFIVASNEHMPY